MGINFGYKKDDSNDLEYYSDFKWSYHGFSNFRERLAKEIGMDIKEMEGFDGEKEFSSYDDDIIPILDHSDCDGELTVDECKKVSPRLRELVKKWSDDDYTDEAYDKRTALLLADLMDECIEKNKNLIFF